MVTDFLQVSLEDNENIKGEIIPEETMIRNILITIFNFSGLFGVLLGCSLNFCICYTFVMIASYRQRWSTVCGKLQDVTLRFQF